MDAVQTKRELRVGNKRTYECEYESDDTSEYHCHSQPRKRIPLSKRTASEIEHKKQERKERNKQSAMESRNRKNTKLTTLEEANSKYFLFFELWNSYILELFILIQLSFVSYL